MRILEASTFAGGAKCFAINQSAYFYSTYIMLGVAMFATLLGHFKTKFYPLERKGRKLCKLLRRVKYDT